MLQAPQLLRHIALHRRLGHRPQVLLFHPCHSTAGPGLLQNVLQNIVDKAAILRGLKTRRTAELRLKAVLHEIGKMAGF